VIALTGIGSLAALDTLVVSTALSTIRVDLGASIEELEWTVNAYNLSFAVLLITAAPLVLARMVESRGPDTGLDMRGLALVTCGALGIVWGLVRGNSAGWGSLEVTGSLLAGALLTAAFVAWERRAREPMLPLALFRSRAFSASNAAMFFTFASLGVSMAIPAAQSSAVGSVAIDAIGKAAGTSSMMRELGGVFGIAVVVAVFAGAGGYASATAFVDGFGPAIGAGAALALAGAACALGLPGRRRAGVVLATPVPALEGESQ